MGKKAQKQYAKADKVIKFSEEEIRNRTEPFELAHLARLNKLSGSIFMQGKNYG